MRGFPSEKHTNFPPRVAKKISTCVNNIKSLPCVKGGAELARGGGIVSIKPIPQSPTVPAFGPGRKHSLLPALAMPSQSPTAPAPPKWEPFKGFFTLHIVPFAQRILQKVRHKVMSITPHCIQKHKIAQNQTALYKIVQNFPR